MIPPAIHLTEGTILDSLSATIVVVGYSSDGGDGDSFLPPSPPRAPPSQVVVFDLLPVQGVWWDLHCGFNLYSPLLLLR